MFVGIWWLVVQIDAVGKYDWMLRWGMVVTCEEIRKRGERGEERGEGREERGERREPAYV